MPDFMKIGLVGAELLQAGRGTVMTNLAVAFRSFANGSDKESKCWTDLFVRRDQRSCKPHFIIPRAKICHIFVTANFRSGCQSWRFSVFLRPSSRCRHWRRWCVGDAVNMCFGGRSFEGRGQETRYPDWGSNIFIRLFRQMLEKRLE
jgi:hypothetical protein